MKVNLKSLFELTRISSINHEIDFIMSKNLKEAAIKVLNSPNINGVTQCDFVLLFSDSNVNKPIGLTTKLDDGT